MIALTLAALLATLDPQAASSSQVPPPVAQPAPQSAPTDLEDVEVIGRRLDRMIQDFVDEVAAPNRNRGIARWRSTVCIGVANLSAEPAQYIVDRVSTIASDVGLNTGAPGCRPNIIVIATDQPDRIAAELVQDHRHALRVGGAGMDRGRAALEDFVASDEPVRWWQVSMPTDADTGQRAVRLPGDCQGDCSGVSTGFAPVISTFASRINTQIVDNLLRTVVVLDIDQASRLSAQQLADYIAMVTLAQIDPAADTTRYASILNVFDDPEAAPSLTNWDVAYLDGLYSAVRTRASLQSGRNEIADSIERAHQRLTVDEPSEQD